MKAKQQIFTSETLELEKIWLFFLLIDLLINVSTLNISSYIYLYIPSHLVKEKDGIFMRFSCPIIPSTFKVSQTSSQLFRQDFLLTVDRVDLISEDMCSSRSRLSSFGS